METPTRVEAPSLGETQGLNSSLDSIAPESGDQVNSKISFSTEEFLRHETNLINKNDHLEPSLQQNSISQASSGVEVSSESISDLITKEAKSQLSEPDKLHNSLNNTSNEVLKLHADSDPTTNSTSRPEHEKFLGESEPVEISCPRRTNENEQLKHHEGEKSASETIVIGGSAGDHPDPPEIINGTVSEESESTSNGKIEDGDVQNKSQSAEFKENEDVAEKAPHEEEWLDILGSGHLMKKVLVAGEPNTRPNKADVCLLSYTGHLEDGTVVDKAENIKIHLNDNEVIQGIDFALALMDKGEEAEIKVGPRFAYGSLGRKPDIPAGATLFYNVRLLDVTEEPPIHSLKVDDRISLGLQKKERGNWWYSRGEHTIAINCYRRALEYLDDTDIPEPHTEEDVGRLLEERLKTYNNLGASQMKINAFDAALMSVNNVLTAQPKNVKALFRKAKIMKEKGELNDSISIVRQALTYDPENQALQQELSSLLAAQRKANSKQRELYKKMMGTGANQEKENEKKTSSKSNYTALKWVTLISFAVAVIGSIAIKYKA